MRDALHDNPLLMIKLFALSKKTKILIISVSVISAITFTIAHFYYRGINNSEDPRIVDSRFMFSRYEKLVKEGDYGNALLILDSIEVLYDKVPGYSDSFEKGLLYNNRGSLLIESALYDTKDSIYKMKLLDSALNYIQDAIHHYENWILKVGSIKEEEVKETISVYFQPNDLAFKGKNYQKILNKRVEDIILAQLETPRRLSVAYTNLGIIQRHQYRQKEAVESYIKAIELWRENPSALSNLNVLFGKPPKDRSILKKLFPPDKNQ